MDERTVRLRLDPASPSARGWRRWRGVVAALGTALALAAAAAALWHGPPAEQPASTPAITAPPQADQAVGAAEIPLLSAAEIEVHRAIVPVLLRLRDHPRVFVLDFPDLESQGSALNRVAALVEKQGLPRDRVLTQAELADAIAAQGDTPATYYYGHDYRGDDLARFFALADRDNIALSGAERWVRDALARARALLPEGEVAVISLAAPGPLLDDDARRAILRHEVAHGRFFTEPDYAALMLRLWREVFTEADRAAFRRWLAQEGYNPADEMLIANEAQAYLLHTDDPRFFRAGLLGLTEADLLRLRRGFETFAAPSGPASATGR